MIVVLPDPVAPTIAYPLPWLHLERHVLEHRLARDVGEGHVLETDHARGSGLGARALEELLAPDAFESRGPSPEPRAFEPRADLHRRIEQREDALGRSHRPLQHVELLGQVADGPEEAL